MTWDFFKLFVMMIFFQGNKYTLPQTQAVFKALVDAIVPVTPELTEKQGSIQSCGALDSHTDEYQIWSLDHFLSLIIILKSFNIHLADAAAEMLNIGAKQLLHMGGNKIPVNSAILPEKGAFAALAPSDRFRAITLLEQKEDDLAILPLPFHNYQGFVFTVIVSITFLAIIGYYTEWSGYGSTRMETPEKRQLEHFPTGWKQVGYPGPSKGYHALKGYLIEKFTE